MLTVLYGNQEITKYVERDSIKIKEALNNRTNSASFTVNDYSIDEGAVCEIWEGTYLTADVVAGTVLPVADTFPFSEKFRPGALLYLNFMNIKKKVYVDSVDHNNKTVTITEPVTYSSGTRLGQLLFGGIITNAPEEEISQGECTPIVSSSVSVSNYRHLFDRKVVVQTFQNQYVREILGRIIRQFCANDSEENIYDFENLGTGGGVLGTQTLETNDRITGNNCLTFGFTGAGVATLTFATAPKDLTVFDKARFFWKIAQDEGIKMLDFKVRLGQIGNYYEWDITNIGFEFEDCWNLESFTLNEFTNTVGSPDLSVVDFVEFYRVMDSGTIAGAMRMDTFDAFTGGFTIKDVQRGTEKFEDVRVSYKKPSVVMETFTKLTGDYRHINYDREMFLYTNQGNEDAPFSLTETSQNYGNMDIKVDITEIKNRQTVRGGEAPDQFDYEQDEIADGEEDSFRLDYKPKDLSIFIDETGTGTSFVEYSVGVENLNEFGEPLTVTNATRLAGVATYTIPSHGFSNGDQVMITGVVPVGFNGTFTISNVTVNTFDVTILVDPGAYISGGAGSQALDFIYNFNEKIVKSKNYGIPIAGAIFRRVYKPYRPIRVRVQDNTSIAKMKLLTKGDGIYDGAVIVEPRIRTFQEARKRAKAEVNVYRNPVVTISFDTNYDGLHPGQLLTISDVDRGINNEKYLIQKVDYSSKSNDYWSYKVSAATTLFGITEFLQLLLKRSDRREIDSDEIVDIVQNVDEVVTMVDDVQAVKEDNEYFAGTIDFKHRDFIHQRWTNFNVISQTNWKIGDDWYSENKGTNAFSSGKTIFSEPLLIIETRDGKCRDSINNEIYIGFSLGGSPVVRGSHNPVDDRVGNPQLAMEFVGDGVVRIPYDGLVVTPDDLSILFENNASGVGSGSDYTLLSWAGISISTSDDTIRIYPNITQSAIDIARVGGDRERIAITIHYDAPDSELKVWKDGELIYTTTFAFDQALYGQWVDGTNGHIGAYQPNINDRPFEGILSYMHIYDRILTDREIKEWTRGYTDKYGLTLVNDGTNTQYPNAWTRYKVNPNTTYDVSVFYSLLEDLSNIGANGGLRVRIVGYQEQRIGGDIGHATGAEFIEEILEEITTKKDWERVTGQFVTTANTEWIGIGVYLDNANGLVRINDLWIAEDGIEAIDNVGRASYCQAF